MVKRAASKVSGQVAKKCKRVAAEIKKAEDVPAPVRAMLTDILGRTFGTYKAERHAFQTESAGLVQQILDNTKGKLQAEIDAAAASKATADNEVTTLGATNDAATAAAGAADTAHNNAKEGVATAKRELKDAQTNLHNLEKEGKEADHKKELTATKKAKIEACRQDYLGPIKEGTKSGAAAGRHVTAVLAPVLAAEFLTCVDRTFAKPSGDWGTFDGIVDSRLATMVTDALAGLATEISTLEAAATARVTSIEAAKGAITAAEEKVKTAEEAATAAAAAAKEAGETAKAAGAALRTGQQTAQKAATVHSNAEDTLKTFTAGALSDFEWLMNREKPEPKPAPAPEGDAPTAEAAMAPAPSAPAATIASSPSIMGAVAGVANAVRNVLPSPRVQTTPRVAASPRKSAAPAESA